MDKKFIEGHIVNAKKSLDEASVKYSPGEMLLSENEYRRIGKLLGKTEEEIEEALKRLPSITLEDLDY